MSRVRRRARAFTLLELMCMLSAASIVLSVLGKLLVDGIYLERIAGERADRLAVVDTMIERLRADALGATAATWNQSETGATVTLRTCCDGGRQQVDWVFRGDDVVRRVDGREADGFQAKRVRFAARIEQGSRFDILVVEMAVRPPARARSNRPRILSEPVLLPRSTLSAASTLPEPNP